MKRGEGAVANGLRGLTTSQILHRLLPQTGLLGISRIINSTPMDCLGLPVVSVIRPNVRDSQITISQGKGRHLRAALAAALIEAVERHSAAQMGEIETASAAALLNAGIPHRSCESLGLDWPAHETVQWLPARRLSDGSRMMVPAGEMLFPYHPPEGVGSPIIPSTSGIAGGGTIEEAIFFALLEVIERHAVSRFLDGAPASLVDPESIASPYLRSVLDRFARRRIDWIALDLSGLAHVPAFFFLSLEEGGLGPARLFAGQAAHVDCERALAAAIFECAQSRIVGLQASREDLRRIEQGWHEPGRAMRLEFELIRRAAECSGVSDFRAIAKRGPTLDRPDAHVLVAIVDDLHAAKTYWTDLTDPRVGLPVASVSVEGMEDFHIDPRRKRTC